MNNQIYKSIWILAIILCGCMSEANNPRVVINTGVRVSYQKLLIIENQNTFPVTIECLYRGGYSVPNTQWVQTMEAGESQQMDAGTSNRSYEFRIYQDGKLLGFITYNLQMPTRE